MATRRQLRAQLRQVPAILRGEIPDRIRIRRVFWGAIGFSMFSQIQQAYELKSQGQADDLGDSWKPLTREYKAYGRPAKPGEVDRHFIRRDKDKGTLGLLTPNQYAKWRKTFGVIFHSEKTNMPEEEALALAGQLAWTKLKAEGAKTKLEVFGDRDTPILRLTDKLYLSLSAGTYYTLSGYQKRNRNQVFRIEKGKLTMGTRDPKAVHVNKTRRLWPVDLSPWLSNALSYASQQLRQHLARVL